jgi:hypothetical protein
MKIRSLFLSFLAILLAFSCSDPWSSQDPAAFTKHITGFTGGVISRNDAIRVRLAAPSDRFESGKEIPVPVFRFDPPVKGKTVMFPDGVVEFKPETPWPSDREIRAEFSLGAFTGVDDGLKTFRFTFRTRRPEITVKPGTLISMRDDGIRMNRYEALLISADALEPAEALKTVSAKYGGEPVNLDLEPGPEANSFRILIDSLVRGPQPTTLLISWDGSDVRISSRGSYEVTLPPAQEFLLLNTTLTPGEDPCLEITFSDPPDPVQDLTGLVFLSEGDPCRVVAEGNIVKLYPLSAITGQRTLVVEASLRNDLGIALKEAVSEKVLFEEPKPAAEFIGQGVIMPDPSGLMLPFRAVNLRAVDVFVFKIFENNIPYFLQQNELNARYFYNFREYGRPVYARTMVLDDQLGAELSKWNSYSLDLSPLMKEDPGAVYRVKLSFRKEYAATACGNGALSDLSGLALDGEFPADRLAAWDGEGWYQEDEWPDDYNWMERDNPCSSSYYTGERFPQKLILSSNIGVLAKSSDGLNFNIVTTDLLQAEPLNDVRILFYNYQNQLIGETLTDREGFSQASLPARPFFLKAVRENQQTWLRLDDGTSLSLSRFDVGGEVVQSGLKGMIYGERGVWRPGDTAFVTFILDDRQNPLPTGHPVSFELFNPLGQKNLTNPSLKGSGGFFSIAIPFPDDAPTGSWRLVARAGGASFEKYLRIETVKPNRLKINMNFSQEVLQSFSGKPDAGLEVRWLHGAPAPGVRAAVELSFRKSPASFTGLEAFTFENPASSFWTDGRNIFDGTLDAAGKGRFTPDLPSGGSAPGMMEAIFLVRAFEQGGDFSTDVFTRKFSPFRNYVGVRVVNGGTYDRMLETDTDQPVEVAFVDWQGRAVASGELDVKVYKVQWRWWWNAGDDDLAYYTGSQDAEVVFSGKVGIGNGRGRFAFRVNYPDWGRYLVLVKDNEGGHQAGLPVYFDWPGSVDRSGRSNPAGATVLSFTADKSKYQPGETAVISFPATPGSRALVTVEKGSRVLSSHWKICRKTEETLEIDITPEMAPNAYVYLGLLQPHLQTANDAPSRLYGVIPVFVEDPATVLDPVIGMPAELRPGEPFSVVVSERKGRPMTFTLAVVDEGLLDLTRFLTPDPHSVFYAREALGVKTWDIYDLVLGAYGGRLSKVFAVGGDRDALLRKDRKPQRFEPVVRYAGPFELPKGGRQEVRFRMPNYVGSVRAMVIAGNEGAYGHAETTVPVRKPLMVLATLPRAIGPGEEVDVPVTVFAMNDSIRQAEIRVETGGLFSPETASAVVTFNGPGERMTSFRIRSGETPGVAKIRITAVSGRETAIHEISLEVRNPGPVISETMSFLVGSGAEMVIPYAFFGVKGSNAAYLAISGIPDFGLQKHLGYLVNYPYGCLEQVVSAAFAQLYLPGLAETSPALRAAIDRNISHAIQKIDRTAMPDGGLPLWPGQTRADNWVTSYAGHFLTLAAGKGYPVPAGLAERWLQYQQRAAGNFRIGSPDQAPGAILSQAYRLYTLSLAGKPNQGAMNRLRESGGLTPSSAWVLAAAYAHAGKPEAAGDLISGRMTFETDPYSSAGETYGSELRDQAFILETLTLLGKEEEAFELMVRMAGSMKNDWLSTQSAAFGLSGITAFTGMSPGKGIDADYTHNATTVRINSTSPLFTDTIGEGEGRSGRIVIRNARPDAPLYASLTLTGKPAPDAQAPTPGSSGISLQVVFRDDAGKPLDVKSIRQGTGFVAEMTVASGSVTGDLTDLAVSLNIPTGWEIIHNRIQDAGAAIPEDSFEYRDIRDDRVVTFFDLPARSSRTFRIRLNASYTGKFYLPVQSCEAMYDRGIHAYAKGQWVEVVR